MLSLTVSKRDPKVSAQKVRVTGEMPAVFYGPKEASTPITVHLKDFKTVWKQAGESSVVILKDGSNEHEALIHDVDTHPLTDEPRHADFYVVEKGKKVQVKVPLVFTGVSSAVKDKGGILVKVIREIEIEATLRDLPRELVVDIAKLVELNDKVHASDITLPSGVALKVSPEEVIASVAQFKEEVVAAPIDMSAIEVEAKGKEVKEGEAGAADAKAGAPADAKKDEKKPEKK